MLQPRTGSPPYLGYVANCYIAILLYPTPLFSPSHPMSARGGLPAHAHSLSTFPTVVSPHRIIHPPRRHLSLSQHKESQRSLHQTLLPPCLLRPCHALRITNAAPLPPPKYLLTLHSAASEPLFSATTDHGAYPLPLRPSPCRKFLLLASTPLTPPLLPAACQ